MIRSQIQKYYQGNLTLLKGAEEQYENQGILLEKEQELMEIHEFGDELICSDGSENHFKVLDDVNTLKNIMMFAEITRYKNTLLSDMDEEERDATNQLIIDNLNRFHVVPVGYEIKKDSILIAWYLSNVINSFRLSDNLCALVD